MKFWLSKKFNYFTTRNVPLGRNGIKWKIIDKNSFKEISKTKRRFLSILIMAFLGVGFYSGLVACSPDMQDSLDKYVDKSNMYDIDVISTLGLTDEDINAIKEIDGVENAYGIQSKDTFINLMIKKVYVK